MSAFLPTKVLHSKVLGGITGPKELAQLGDIIAVEKQVVLATQKLAEVRTRSSVALKEWGVQEGPDLKDILAKVALLFDYLSSAETKFAEHDANFRLHFKSIRSKEESLAQLKRSQSSLASKIDTQEKKVTRMKDENKELPAATQKLSEMREELVGLDHSVTNEETRLGDFKRTSTRDALSLKFGAILELGEKLQIVADMGKLLVDVIPTQKTEPGAPRRNYGDFEKTDEIMMEAHRCMQGVLFSPVPFAQDETRDSGEDDRRPPNGETPFSPSSHYPEDSYASSRGEFGGGELPDDRYNSAWSRPNDPPARLDPPRLPAINTQTSFGNMDDLPRDPSEEDFGSRLGVPMYGDEPGNRSSLAYMDDETGSGPSVTTPRAEGGRQVSDYREVDYATNNGTAPQDAWADSSRPSNPPVPTFTHSVRQSFDGSSGQQRNGTPPTSPQRGGRLYSNVSEEAAAPSRDRGNPNPLGSKHGFDSSYTHLGGGGSTGGGITPRSERASFTGVGSGGSSSGYNQQVYDASSIPYKPPSNAFFGSSAHERGHSQSDAIRDAYLARTPYGVSDGLGGDDDVATPRFEVQPLRVDKRQAPVRAGSVPGPAGAQGARQQSGPPSNNGRDDYSSHRTSSDAPSSNGGTQGSYTSPPPPSYQSGFSSNAFVTRLD